MPRFILRTSHTVMRDEVAAIMEAADSSSFTSLARLPVPESSSLVTAELSNMIRYAARKLLHALSTRLCSASFGSMPAGGHSVAGTPSSEPNQTNSKFFGPKAGTMRQRVPKNLLKMSSWAELLELLQSQATETAPQVSGGP